MRASFARTVILGSAYLLISCRAQERARVRALDAALTPFSQIEITTGERVNVGPDVLPYLRRFETAQLITISEAGQDFWGGFATRTYMEGAKPYSIAPTQRLAQIALNPRSAPAGGVDLPVAKIKEDMEYEWNFYAREVIYLGLNLLGNTTSFGRPDGTPPAALTLMSDYPKYEALARKGFLVLDEASIPPDAYSRAKLDRAVRVSITPAGEKVANLDRKANTATFVFGTHRLEQVLVNSPIATSAGVYRLVEGTHVFDLNPIYADLYAQFGWPTYRERRFRKIYTYKGYEMTDANGNRSTSAPSWRTARRDENHSAYDLGPRDGPFESTDVPPTLRALREGSGDDRYTWRIHLADLKTGEVIRDEEYKGPLATPGETFRLVLASIQQVPATPKAAISKDLAGLLPGRLRSVLKYDPFTKNWKVVALDVGPSGSDTWYSSHVQ